MLIQRRRMMMSKNITTDFVDLGLPSGILWAVGNICKDSNGDYRMGSGTERGAYFSWGNIEGHVSSNGSTFDDGYDFGTDTSGPYASTPGASLTGNIPVNATYDAARARLGGLWRIPKSADYEELVDNTDTEIISDYNGTGLKFMKKTDHSIFIVIPFTGDARGTAVENPTIGMYWSSSLNSTNNVPYSLIIDSSSIIPLYNGRTKFYGTAIRPVFKLMFSITITLEGEDVEGITVTVTDSDGISHSGTTNSNGVVQLTGVASGSAKVSASGYQLTNSSITVNASSRSFTCGLAPLGVWAYYAGGVLKSEAEADSNAIGVAVISANCGFVIDKLATNSDSTIRYGGYNKDLSSIGVVVTSNAATAKLDFDGEGNTTKIITALSGYNDGYSTGAPACEACRAAFGGNGYIGSLGEWNEAYANKASVNSMMTKIGGTAISSNYYWASTLNNASTYSWMLSWSGGGTNRYGRNSLARVRAFRAL